MFDGSPQADVTSFLHHSYTLSVVPSRFNRHHRLAVEPAHFTLVRVSRMCVCGVRLLVALYHMHHLVGWYESVAAVLATQLLTQAWTGQQIEHSLTIARWLARCSGRWPSHSGESCLKHNKPPSLPCNSYQQFFARVPLRGATCILIEGMSMCRQHC